MEINNGDSFGNLISTGIKERRGYVDFYECKCSCGQTKFISKYHLLNGHTKTCGNCIKGTDYSGQKFNKLTLLKFHHLKGKHPYRKCMCECGKQKVIGLYSILQGTIQSCGCLLGQGSVTHGMSKSRFYSVWSGILTRCYKQKSQNYYLYGGRGIVCCNERLRFENFRDDMYESYLKHIEKFGIKNTTIDRIDSDGNYCKENCKWSTLIDQANNKSNNVFYTYNGFTGTLAQLAKEYRLDYKRVYYRIHRFGWDLDKALTTPVKTKFISLKYKHATANA